ncbi:hypothetical protein TRVL_02647 [Trypanosoma vivax]|nr:hypothetical protein TRVL_02647 [Trypanosoma vivax]
MASCWKTNVERREDGEEEELSGNSVQAARRSLCIALVRRAAVTQGLRRRKRSVAVEGQIGRSFCVLKGVFQWGNRGKKFIADCAISKGLREEGNNGGRRGGFVEKKRGKGNGIPRIRGKIWQQGEWKRAAEVERDTRSWFLPF